MYLKFESGSSFCIGTMSPSCPIEILKLIQLEALNFKHKLLLLTFKEDFKLVKFTSYLYLH